MSSRIRAKWFWEQNGRNNNFNSRLVSPLESWIKSQIPYNNYYIIMRSFPESSENRGVYYTPRILHEKEFQPPGGRFGWRALICVKLYILSCAESLRSLDTISVTDSWMFLLSSVPSVWNDILRFQSRMIKLIKELSYTKCCEYVLWLKH